MVSLSHLAATFLYLCIFVGMERPSASRYKHSLSSVTVLLFFCERHYTVCACFLLGRKAVVVVFFVTVVLAHTLGVYLIVQLSEQLWCFGQRRRQEVLSRRSKQQGFWEGSRFNWVRGRVSVAVGGRMRHEVTQKLEAFHCLRSDHDHLAHISPLTFNTHSKSAEQRTISK